jgi:hypothetical protein
MLAKIKVVRGTMRVEYICQISITVENGPGLIFSPISGRLTGKVENIVQLQRGARPQVTLSIHSRSPELIRHFILGFKKRGLK